MLNKIYIDTNIFIDLLINETCFNEYKKIRSDIKKVTETKEVVKNYIDGDTIFVFNSLTVSNAFYLFANRQKMDSKVIAKKILDLKRKSMFMCFLENNRIIDEALSYSSNHNADYEDALQYFCALHSNCSMIITNDKNFPMLDIPLKRTSLDLDDYNPN